MQSGCALTEFILGRTVRVLRLENYWLAVTILLDKGADIYELIYKPKQMDVLWKSPWGLKEPGRGPANFTTNSEVAWLEHYAGGWQELFPNGGDACQYRGVELSFHGEASMIPWDYEVIHNNPQTVEVRLYTRLRRSPFSIERRMRVDSHQPILTICGRITNEAGEPMDYMWSHHPAFGAPFLSEACRIDTGAKTLVVDDVYKGTHNPLERNAHYAWPLTSTGIDLSHVPGKTAQRDLLAYFTDYDDTGWYAITNTELGFGVGLAWPRKNFPYAWFWQEINASPGFPFYQNCYVMAIEPATSIPGRGLVSVMEKTGTHRSLSPGASEEITIQTIFYETNTGVAHLASDGQIVFR
jgi:hypothetical protein